LVGQDGAANYVRVQGRSDLTPEDFLSRRVAEYDSEQKLHFVDKLLAIEKLRVNGNAFPGIFQFDELDKTPGRAIFGLLEAMEEQQVTLPSTGESLKLNCCVWAAANTKKFDSQSQVIPRAIQDRFSAVIFLDYLSVEEDLAVLNLVGSGVKRIAPSISQIDNGAVQKLQQWVAQHGMPVSASEEIKKGCVTAVKLTQQKVSGFTDFTRFIKTPSGPRGYIDLFQEAVCQALLAGSSVLQPDHCIAVGVRALRGRIEATAEAEMEGKTADITISDILQEVFGKVGPQSGGNGSGADNPMPEDDSDDDKEDSSETGQPADEENSGPSEEKELADNEQGDEDTVDTGEESAENSEEEPENSDSTDESQDGEEEKDQTPEFDEQPQQPQFGQKPNPNKQSQQKFLSGFRRNMDPKKNSIIRQPERKPDQRNQNPSQQPKDSQDKDSQESNQNESEGDDSEQPADSDAGKNQQSKKSQQDGLENKSSSDSSKESNKSNEKKVGEENGAGEEKGEKDGSQESSNGSDAGNESQKPGEGQQSSEGESDQGNSSQSGQTGSQSGQGSEGSSQEGPEGQQGQGDTGGSQNANAGNEESKTGSGESDSAESTESGGEGNGEPGQLQQGSGGGENQSSANNAGNGQSLIKQVVDVKALANLLAQKYASKMFQTKEGLKTGAEIAKEINQGGEQKFDIRSQDGSLEAKVRGEKAIVEGKSETMDKLQITKGDQQDGQPSPQTGSGGSGAAVAAKVDATPMMEASSVPNELKSIMPALRELGAEGQIELLTRWTETPPANRSRLSVEYKLLKGAAHLNALKAIKQFDEVTDGAATTSHAGERVDFLTGYRPELPLDEERTFINASESGGVLDDQSYVHERRLTTDAPHFIFIIDCSGSMGMYSRMASALASGTAICQYYGPRGATFGVIQFANNPNIGIRPPESDTDKVIDAILQCSPGMGTSYAPALECAFTVALPNTTVVVFGDFEDNSLPSAQALGLKKEKDIKVIGVVADQGHPDYAMQICDEVNLVDMQDPTTVALVTLEATKQQ
jgi:MoxR-like ATPase/Mg-chelatase subunit ChlD